MWMQVPTELLPTTMSIFSCDNATISLFFSLTASSHMLTVFSAPSIVQNQNIFKRKLQTKTTRNNSLLSSPSHFRVFNPALLNVAVRVQYKKYQQNMKDSNDKENEVPSPLTLDFKKKPISKPNTDRSSTVGLSQLKKDISEIHSQAISLLEKKKQYSMAIREKNLTTQGKKGKNDMTIEQDQSKEPNNNESMRSNSLTSNTNLAHFSSQNSQKASKISENLKSKLREKEIDSKSKCKQARRDKGKIKQISQVVEDFRGYGLSNKWLDPNGSERSRISQHRQSEYFQNISMISRIQESTVIENKLSLNSQQISHKIGPFQSEEIKELQLIKRQNNTYKKDLANYRKENGSLKRELEEYKKQLQQLKEKNEFLVTQNEDQLKILENFQMRMSESLDAGLTKNDGDQLDESMENDNKLKQILKGYENQLFQANSLNKKLEFRNYMLEKRLMDETQSHRKILARQISVWKERYIKARNENMRMKDSRSQLLFQMSISEQM